MKRILYLFSTFLIISSAFSQEKITPEKKVTYGNPVHTNRDYLNSTLKDNKNDIYLVGSTENDFSFNDLKIIKLNKDLEVIWEIEKTFDLTFSYDVPLATHVDSGNNLIVICRSAYTSANQTIFVLKYNENGELLWEYPFSDLNNPQDYDVNSIYSYLDDSDNLNLMYRPVEQTEFKYFFLKISPIGQKIDEYSKTEQFVAGDGLLNPYKIVNNNGVYNMLIIEDLEVDPWQEITLHKFNKDINESYKLDLDSEATNYFNTPFAETWTIMKKDNLDNLILVAPSYQIHKDYSILNVNSDGTIKYKIFPDNTNDKYPLDFGFDVDNNLIIVSNNRLSNTEDPLKTTIQKYNQNGELIFEGSSDYAASYAVIQGETIAVLTDDNQIVTFDADLSFVNAVQLNTINTYNFVINDLLKIDANYYLSGSTEDINYAGSILISEVDMLIKKANTTNEINSYRYSGVGTSKVFKRKELVVRDTAYAFAITEKLGPDAFFIGGSVSPEQQRFVTIDKNDLQILEDKVVPLNESLLTTYYPKELSTTYTSINGDEYEYLIKSDTTQVSLFLNNSLQWTRGLDLYNDPNGDAIISDDEVIFDWKVNGKGDFLLTTHIYGLKQCTLHKYSLDNEYKSLVFNELMLAVVPMTNHWLFTVNQSGYITIYSDRLSVINEVSNRIDPNLGQFAFYIKEKNNQVLFNKHGDNIVKVYNQFGEQKSDYFEIDADMANSNIEYDENNFIIVEQVGSSLYLQPWYSWSRAVIKKYDLDISDNFSEISYADDDNDGVTNDIDECRNTANNEQSNEFGCSESQTLSIEDYTLNNMTVYPNPTKNVIYLQSNNEYNIEGIEIFDVVGRKVLTRAKSELINQNKIDMSNQQNGIYFLKFTFDNGSQLSKKIVVKNDSN